jgi:L-malate glycosyltransferase
MTKLAIVTLMNGFPWGGSEYLWADTASQALAAGHEVLISLYDWAIDHPLVTQLQHQGAQLHIRPRFPQPLSLPTRIKRNIHRSIPVLSPPVEPSPFQPIFDWQPDVIFISQGSTYGIAHNQDLYKLLFAYSIPYWIVCHFNAETHQPAPATRSHIQKIFAQASGIAFVSQHNLKLAERHLSQRLANAIVVQNPVNLSDRTSVNWNQSSEVCFACVARLEIEFKGQDSLFEALSFPIWRERNWQCYLYGTGPDQEHLAAVANHYGISDRVHFKGHISDVRSIWAENHLLVLPSRAEGTPLSLVEAMLCGRPAVVTDVGGNAEWVEEGQTGFIAAAPTAQSLHSALERAWLSQEHWKTMGDRAHEVATAKFEPFPGQQLLRLMLNSVK